MQVTALRMFMTHAMLLSGLLAWAIMLQAQALAPTEKSKDEKCSVEGRVVSSTTGGPLARTTLTLTGSTAATGMTAPTDENGRFEFQGLSAGRYTLTGERAGYLPQAYGARPGSASGTPLVLAAGQQLKDVLFKLVPAAAISGRVLDENGEPAVDMGVMALRSSYQRGVRQWVQAGSAIVNDLGEFRITGLSKGSYLLGTTNRRTLGGTGLSADAPGDKPEREYALTFYPSAMEVAAAVPVQVAAGSETDGVAIRWQKLDTVRVRGKIVGAGSGSPAVVRLSPRGVTDSTLAYWQGGGASRLGKDGSFEIKGVTPGAYLLSAGFLAGEDFHVATAFVQVGGQHIDGLVLQPVPALELAGAVEVADNAAAKLNSVQIGLEPAEYVGITTFFGKVGFLTTVAPPATAREDGRFTLKMVPPNRYRVQVRSLPEGSYVKAVRYGGQMVSEEGIDLTNGVSGSLQVTLSMAGARVDGVVQGTDDKPVSGATVVLAPASQRYSLFKETWTGEDGSYSIQGIAPGEYRILAWDDIEPGAYQDPEVLKRFEGRAEKLSLKEGDRKSLTLKVIPSGEN